jgi:D-sedoheptulose 7-phosphate isomerase
MKKTIINEFQSHLKTINNIINNMEDQLVAASTLTVETLKAGNKILLCGWWKCCRCTTYSSRTYRKI